MKKRNKKKMSGYKRSLLIFALILLILGEFALVYVNKSLKMYETGNINNYLNNLLLDIQKQGKKGNIEKYFELAKVEKNPYEKKSSLKNGYKELLASAKMSYKKKDKNIYDLYADDNLLATATLNDEETIHRLGLLTFTNFKIDNMVAYNEDGLFEVNAYIPSGYKLYVNNIEVAKDELLDSAMIEGFEDAYEYVDLPKYNHYKVSKLTKKPEVIIKDEDNKKVESKYENGNYFLNNFYKTDDKKEAFKKLDHDYDPLDFAETWSMFLSAEYDTEYGRGLNRVAPNLIEGTKMYKKARDWATNVDITFTSIHTLDKEPFTNEKLSNFVIFSNNAFSVEVYLEKNMTLYGGTKKKDVLHDIIYFVYYDGSYRVVHMKAVTDK